MSISMVLLAVYIRTLPLLSSTMRSNSGWNSMYKLSWKIELANMDGARWLVPTNWVLDASSGEAGSLVANNVLLDTVRGRGFSQQLRMTSLV